MKLSFLPKKALAFSLCIALLISCLVFAGPSAVAQGEVKSTLIDAEQTYCFRILIVEDRDHSFDPASDNKDYQQSPLWEDYATVTYRTQNGLGEEKSITFNLGDGDAAGRYNVVSGSGDDYGYFPSDDGVEVSGFPTNAFCNYNIKNSGRKGGFYAYFQIAKKVEGEWSWASYGGTCTDRGFLNLGGSIDNSYKKSIGDIVGHTYIDASDNPQAGTDISCTIQVPNSCYPYAVNNTADTVGFYEGDVASAAVDCPATPEQAVNTRTLHFTSPEDQYGVTMVPTVSYYGECSTEGIEFVDGTLQVGYAANLAGDTDEQPLYTTLTWRQKDKTNPEITAAPQMTIRDANYDVQWLSYSGDIYKTEQYCFGDIPAQTVPQKACDTVHYLNGHWDHAYEVVSESSNNTYQAQYDLAEHQFTEYESVNDMLHKVKCSVEADNVHYRTEEHSLTKKVEPATCGVEGYTQYVCDLCGYESEKSDYTAALKHKWDSGVITTQPTCTQSGEKTLTCLNCGATTLENIGKLSHDPELITIAPEDGTAGKVCFECSICHNVYWKATFDGTEYDIEDDEQTFATQQEALQASDDVCAPAFNLFADTQVKVDYSVRGASLRYCDATGITSQPMRFMASVRVPDGVSANIGAAGDAVVDAGFVYADNEDVNGDITRLQRKKAAISELSIAQKNAGNGVFTGKNWGGISKHEADDGTHLTFNLVIPVAQTDWQKYCAVRAYIVYRYHGMEYTVYDSEFTSRSVEYVARMVITNAKESQQARDYCRNEIINKL